MKPLERWEALWAPYDEPTYQLVLDYVRPDDVVLDIGAGDLRLTRRVAAVAQRVYALERDPAVLARSERGSWPANLVVICADAAADAIVAPPSADAPARNSRLESPDVAVPFMLPPCASSRREGYAGADRMTTV